MVTARGSQRSASGWPLHTRDRSPLLELDSDREIEPVDVERNFNFLGVQNTDGPGHFRIAGLLSRRFRRWITQSLSSPAARLEALAEPGGICVSGTVQAHIGTKLAVEFIDLGPQQVPIGRFHHGAYPSATYSVSLIAVSSLARSRNSPRSVQLASPSSRAIFSKSSARSRNSSMVTAITEYSFSWLTWCSDAERPDRSGESRSCLVVRCRARPSTVAKTRRHNLQRYC